ncbi:hypothetical protein ACFXPN_42570 [Streptomyces griseorubiginosus]|uniref:hypothetical protein n=1 Tax=Streptomyces griseorubiginosus TaxID=67304 RepID=UPI0036C8A8D5
MTAIEWLLWGSLVCLVFWAYQAFDLARLVAREREKPKPAPTPPHWARTGHLPPAPKHGRHARR